MMPEKIFTCLTWPAITAWDTPAALRILMHLPKLPERHPVQLRAGIARRLLQIGERLLLDGDDRHIMPQGPGALQHEKWKPAVAGNQTDSAHCVEGSSLSDAPGRSGGLAASRPVFPAGSLRGAGLGRKSPPGDTCAVRSTYHLGSTATERSLLTGPDR